VTFEFEFEFAFEFSFRVVCRCLFFFIIIWFVVVFAFVVDSVFLMCFIHVCDCDDVRDCFVLSLWRILFE